MSLIASGSFLILLGGSQICHFRWLVESTILWRENLLYYRKPSIDQLKIITFYLLLTVFIYAKHGFYPGTLAVDFISLTSLNQSCKMSQVLQIYLCKNI